MKAARKRSGYTAQEAAELLTARGLECSRGTLLAWERGIGPTTREPFASDLAIISEVYGCQVDEFFAVEPSADGQLRSH
jgi:transcriptional regulator with XRE-family HTH domain